ncbi:hypothetical protein [Streptomyces sp. NRRL B-24484]|uniref:hypothetical protein n=1 Tax=Streptomyces sp. NRRL B-24484 TaxID=1463833 RepID=UPI0004BE8296|nr:hypothetical protein [Streptomyces sp. NRRL B-24484]
MPYSTDDTPGMRYAQAAQSELNKAGAEPDRPHQLLRLPSFEGYLGECPCGEWKPGPQPTFGDLLASLAQHYKAVGYTPPARSPIVPGGPTGELEWIPAEDVKEGMRLACRLSDASAYPTVTGWTDKHLTHSPGTVHRHFEVSGAPWWVDDDMLRCGLGHRAKMLVVRERSAERQ